MVTVPMLDVSPQELHESGLLWLANRTLHPFGYAIAAVKDEQGEFVGLSAVRTSDPLGLTFSEETEDAARRRFFAWVGSRSEAGPMTGGGSGTDPDGPEEPVDPPDE